MAEDLADPSDRGCKNRRVELRPNPDVYRDSKQVISTQFAVTNVWCNSPLVRSRISLTFGPSRATLISNLSGVRSFL